LVYYHLHGGEQITTNIGKKIAGLKRLNEKNQTYLQEHPQAFWVRNMKLARVYARGGTLKKALGIWMKAAAKCPWKLMQNGKYMALILREKFRTARR
ncbi:MAG: hypothetical protein K2K10_10060, partial [Acetatifactor sp.]|nr:hypothetical protein [Acetatifactor sp.]